MLILIIFIEQRKVKLSKKVECVCVCVWEIASGKCIYIPKIEYIWELKHVLRQEDESAIQVGVKGEVVPPQDDLDNKVFFFFEFHRMLFFSSD